MEAEITLLRQKLANAYVKQLRNIAIQGSIPSSGRKQELLDSILKKAAICPTFYERCIQTNIIPMKRQPRKSSTLENDSFRQHSPFAEKSAEYTDNTLRKRMKGNEDEVHIASSFKDICLKCASPYSPVMRDIIWCPICGTIQHASCAWGEISFYECSSFSDTWMTTPLQLLLLTIQLFNCAVIVEEGYGHRFNELNNNRKYNNIISRYNIQSAISRISPQSLKKSDPNGSGIIWDLLLDYLKVLLSCKNEDSFSMAFQFIQECLPPRSVLPKGSKIEPHTRVTPNVDPEGNIDCYTLKCSSCSILCADPMMSIGVKPRRVFDGGHVYRLETPPPYFVDLPLSLFLKDSFLPCIISLLQILGLPKTREILDDFHTDKKLFKFSDIDKSRLQASIWEGKVPESFVGNRFSTPTKKFLLKHQLILPLNWKELKNLGWKVGLACVSSSVQGQRHPGSLLYPHELKMELNRHLDTIASEPDDLQKRRDRFYDLTPIVHGGANHMVLNITTKVVALPKTHSYSGTASGYAPQFNISVFFYNQGDADMVFKEIIVRNVIKMASYLNSSLKILNLARLQSNNTPSFREIVEKNIIETTASQPTLTTSMFHLNQPLIPQNYDIQNRFQFFDPTVCITNCLEVIDPFIPLLTVDVMISEYDTFISDSKLKIAGIPPNSTDAALKLFKNRIHDVVSHTHSVGDGNDMENNAVLVKNSINSKTSSSDVEEVVEQARNPVLKTRDPVSLMPIEVPVRGIYCSHEQPFDLWSFLASKLGSVKPVYPHPVRWRCPLCDNEIIPEDLEIDFGVWIAMQRLKTKVTDNELKKSNSTTKEPIASSILNSILPESVKDKIDEKVSEFSITWSKLTVDIHNVSYSVRSYDHFQSTTFTAAKKECIKDDTEALPNVNEQTRHNNNTELIMVLSEEEQEEVQGKSVLGNHNEYIHPYLSEQEPTLFNNQETGRAVQELQANKDDVQNFITETTNHNNIQLFINLSSSSSDN